MLPFTETPMSTDTTASVRDSYTRRGTTNRRSEALAESLTPAEWATRVRAHPSRGRCR